MREEQDDRILSHIGTVIQRLKKLRVKRNILDKKAERFRKN